MKDFKIFLLLTAGLALFPAEVSMTFRMCPLRAN